MLSPGNLRDQHMFDTLVRFLKAKPGADGWDEPMEIREILPSREDSYERIMHNTGIPSFLLDLRESVENADMRPALDMPMRERFIGVIYRSDTELWSHYSKSILPKQLDALVWFDQTSPVLAFETVQPLEPVSTEDTYPFGF